MNTLHEQYKSYYKAILNGCDMMKRGEVINATTHAALCQKLDAIGHELTEEECGILEKEVSVQ